MKIELEVAVVRIPRDLSDEDRSTVMDWHAMKVAKGYLYLGLFESESQWRIHGYVHEEGISPCYLVLPSEKAARSMIERLFPDATHASGQIMQAPRSFRGLYRTGEAKKPDSMKGLAN